MAQTKHSAPQRTCISCRSNTDKKDLVRIVKSPNGSLLIDLTEKMKSPGRGAYVCMTDSCFKKAFKNKLYVKALRTDEGCLL